MRHIQSITSKLLLFSVVTVVCLGASELIVANFFPQQTISYVQSFSFRCFEEGDHRWIKMKKNATCMLKSMYDSFAPVEVKTNSQGFRNSPISPTKPERTKRVLFIGDSFTMGWGVREPDSFVRKTESMLKQHTVPYNIETINAGFTAAGPSGYYLSLKLDGMNLDPDIVVVGFYLGNDILSRKDVEWVKVDAQGLPDIVRSKTSYIDPTGQLRVKQLPLQYHIPYLRQSHLFILIMKTLFPHANMPTQTELIQDTVCIFNKNCHDFDQGKSEIKMLFQAMDAQLKKQGKHLVIAIIPTHFQVHFTAEYKTRYDLPLLPSERRKLNDEFIQYFTQQNIDYIDLLPHLLTHAGNERLYFNFDDHWNEAGHRVAAQTISEKLLPLLE